MSAERRKMKELWAREHTQVDVLTSNFQIEFAFSVEFSGTNGSAGVIDHM